MVFITFIGKCIAKRINDTDDGCQNDVESGTEMPPPPAYNREKTPAVTSSEIRGLPEQPAPAYTV